MTINPLCSPHYRLGAQRGAGKFAERAFELAKLISFTPQQVAALYNAPKGVTGKGVKIGIIELGGGYATSDLEAFMSTLSSRVHTVSIDGATNTTGSDADYEVSLDIQIAGAVAPGAEIYVYFAPNTEQGYVDALNQANSDGCLVGSTSWGAAEDAWTVAGRKGIDGALEDAAVKSAIWFGAAGDSGSGDGEEGTHVDYPGSSIWMICCGGTRVLANAGIITAETVWNDGTAGGSTGGGVSAAYALPSWQKACYVTQVGGTPQLLTMRGVPDVCGNGDPQTGYQIVVAGQQVIVAGTSAVSPLWAGLTALLVEANGGKGVGPLYKHIYGRSLVNRSKFLRGISAGNNGAYEATLGWNACGGLGSPKNLVGLL